MVGGWHISFHETIQRAIRDRNEFMQTKIRNESGTYDVVNITYVSEESGFGSKIIWR